MAITYNAAVPYNSPVHTYNGDTTVAYRLTATDRGLTVTESYTLTTSEAALTFRESP